MESSPADEPVIRFRAGKKRKAYRQRTDDNDDDDSNNNNNLSTAEPAPKTLEALLSDAAAHGAAVRDESSVAAALRLRTARRSRIRGGVGFTTAAKQDEQASGERALVLQSADGASDGEVGLRSVGERFTHQTGLLADMNDKHMMEYIESRLSSRKSGATPSNAKSAPAAAPTATTAATAKAPSGPPPSAKPEGGHAVMQGHLMEIDLGEEARDINVARTERATLHGGGSAPSDDASGGRRAKKPRLGRDGKPWRPRNRRPSDAIKRDQLVDEILRENRLDVYEAPAEPSAEASGVNEHGAADDRLAEEFRQQFLDDVAQRQLKKKKLTNQPVRPGAEDVLKGPKLGGSRNVRAAMRDLLLKKEKGGKK
ncbi:hypothetical protein B0J13DRAFT_25968 [Dactylonectria estremocensis]|uniref:Uncharacterized protein n=1 Tax=Dactylonectria estremocensis TaxID=1079267 RepID=A0A9P9FJU4_9HYPO|nr:hypothetical protein B0J13DRAFT_25968 [Dactylonectria estremocensis]